MAYSLPIRPAALPSTKAPQRPASSLLTGPAAQLHPADMSATPVSIQWRDGTMSESVMQRMSPVASARPRFATDVHGRRGRDADVPHPGLVDRGSPLPDEDDLDRVLVRLLQECGEEPVERALTALERDYDTDRARGA